MLRLSWKTPLLDKKQISMTKSFRKIWLNNLKIVLILFTCKGKNFNEITTLLMSPVNLFLKLNCFAEPSSSVESLGPYRLTLPAWIWIVNQLDFLIVKLYNEEVRFLLSQRVLLFRSLILLILLKLRFYWVNLFFFFWQIRNIW